jgi:hypothetical protein
VAGVLLITALTVWFVARRRSVTATDDTADTTEPAELDGDGEIDEDDEYLDEEGYDNAVDETRFEEAGEAGDVEITHEAEEAEVSPTPRAKRAGSGRRRTSK